MVYTFPDLSERFLKNDNFNSFPSISDGERKRICYITKSLFTEIWKSSGPKMPKL
jgi:hypothetical protein